MSKAQEKKDNLITDLIQARLSVLDAACSLSPAQQDEVFLGVWSVKDLLAHLAGWDYANIEGTQAILAGRLPAFYAHHDRDWQSFNAQLVTRFRQDDFADLVACVEASHRELIDLLESVPAVEWSRDRGLRFRGYRVTIANLLRAEASDEAKHGAQIKEFATRM